jgi:hypothetical protein
MRPLEGGGLGLSLRSSAPGMFIGVCFRGGLSRTVELGLEEEGY